MKYLIILITIFLSIGLHAEDANLLFSKANQAFADQNYAEAIELYEQVRAQNQHSANYYFNLGNAYFENNELGKAILNYERGKLLRPNFKDLNYNLDLARNRQKDNISKVKPFFLSIWWQAIYNLMLPSIWGILGILLLFATVVGIGFWLLGSSRPQKQIGFYGAIGTGIFAIVFLLAGYSRHLSMTNSDEAIIIAKVTNFKDGADADSNTTQKLHEGTKVILVEVIADWQKVRLESGEQGWLKIDDFEKITDKRKA